MNKTTVQGDVHYHEDCAENIEKAVRLLDFRNEEDEELFCDWCMEPLDRPEVEE